MSIPLDRLYHYIESVAQDVYGDTVIYHFYPHGSKNIEDLNPAKQHTEKTILVHPQIFCNDQEPLDFNLYAEHNQFHRAPLDIYDPTSNALFRQNIRKNVFNIFDKCILLHSEKNSNQIKKYTDLGFIPTYYWSHALISLDWFRYAQYLKPNNNLKKFNFLLYNRAWTGTREYRLKIADLIIDQDLISHCKMSLAFCEDQIHYSDHQYRNACWKPKNVLENFFLENTTTSCYSADFNEYDYQNTHWEIVLETLFDQDRIFLTEKTLRPIALGQPFILCAPAGSLSYLRSYGFKTFSGIINEEYDLIADPVDRLNAVINVMSTISSWTNSEKQKKIQEMTEIADFNKKHFFSNNFYNLIVNELKTNLSQSLTELINTNTFERCINAISAYYDNTTLLNWYRGIPGSGPVLDATEFAFNLATTLKNKQ